ncbi:MAG: GDP-mannose 4,6-dehydratase, partial [Ignisphaera sp.]
MEFVRVLITGGAGFIGHNVACYLAKRGYDVVVVDT